MKSFFVIFERGDVVIAPFPFTDLPVTKRRPVVVLSNTDVFNQATGHAICAMITGAKKSSWPLDSPIDDLEAAGLRGPCVVRMKIVTLDSRIMGSKCGRLASNDLERVTDNFYALTNGSRST